MVRKVTAREQTIISAANIGMIIMIPKRSVKFFSDFLAVGLQHLKPNSAIYQWHAHRRQALVEQAWTANGLLIHQQIIWYKGFGILTHSHYMWAHEPCFYGWVEGQAPSKKPPANTISVWTVSPKPENLNIHPTQKPVELFMQADRIPHRNGGYLL